MSTTWRRRILLGLVLWLGLVAAPARAEDWIELRTPHFTVVSEVSESRTRAWGVEFELFRRGMNILMPVAPGAAEPVTLVLFRSDRRLRPFKPLEDGKPARMAGYFSRSLGRNFIAIAVEGARDDVREIIFHEGVHWHLAGMTRDLPLWMEEGLAEVFGNFTLNGGSFIVGSARWDFVRNVRVMKPMPMPTLMAVDRLAYNGKHSRQTELFYYQSWAMMHALLFAPDGVGYANFARFLRETPSGDRFEDELERKLGKAPADLQRLMLTHLERKSMNFLKVPFDRKAVEADFKIRPLSAGEVDLTLGSLLVGVARPEEARPYLLRAETALAADPRPQEALAMMSLSLGDAEEMARYFREAFRRGGRNYVGHYLLGQQELQQGPRVTLGTLDLSKAADEFMACLAINPRFVPAIEALAGVLVFIPQRSLPAEMTVRFAAKQHPRNFRILAGLALLDATYSDPAMARIAIKRAGELLAQAGPDPAGNGLLNMASETLDRRERGDMKSLFTP